MSGEFSLSQVRKRRRYTNDLTAEKLRKEGIFYFEYPAVNYSSNIRRYLLPGIDESYGVTYHSEEYIRQEWSKNFDVLDIQKGAIDNLQDLVVLRKK